MAENVNKLKKHKNHCYQKKKANELLHPNRCCKFKCKAFLNERTHFCHTSQCVQHVNAITVSVYLSYPLHCLLSTVWRLQEVWHMGESDLEKRAPSAIVSDMALLLLRSGEVNQSVAEEE